MRCARDVSNFAASSQTRQGLVTDQVGKQRAIYGIRASWPIGL